MTRFAVHTYLKDSNVAEAERSLEFFHHSRHDGMAKLELDAEWMTETYIERLDKYVWKHTWKKAQ